MKKLVSIITPMYNEEENIVRYFKEMNKAIKKLEDKYNFEFIITDNCSTDNTYKLLEEKAKKDKRIKVYTFSKNYGYQRSIWTGYSKSKGDVTIEYDADLQDPPVLLEKFLKEWENGNKIVYGIRTHRQESKIFTKLRTLFYFILQKISSNNLPLNAGDFLMLDRQVIDNLVNIKDQNPYLRGTIFSFGFKRKGIEYKRNSRQAGKSKFPFYKCLNLAIDAIISQSVFPLRIATYIGLTVTCITIFLSGFYIFAKFFTDINMPTGFTTTAVLILFSISINALFLGIIGEYLARIYKQVKPEPITIIEKEINRSI